MTANEIHSRLVALANALEEAFDRGDPDEIKSIERQMDALAEARAIQFTRGADLS